MPSCTCHDWQNSPYLCKHFFAIFKKFPAWSCDSLPDMYRNSPFMTLDSLSDEQQPPEPDMVEGMQSDVTSSFGVFEIVPTLL